ncbi:PPOX class F420-dependent oxidoreductase [Paractinoplanes rhizophilus]|jgi:PPOX class probable F420-dependent enzyme|uniref:PPOX class F420-dependent oxidoreductase n=1 Tax=Paractinoplanes rhizophilus TaxID=1416877 RepID=A0ABW2I3E2_9ACTN|nr:PPOX class F420-dependent oxidoreductase [Actinoplanes sp.]
MTVPPEIAASKQISLTTYRKDGTPVATPVWHVAEGDKLTTVSAADAGKVKRLRRNPNVEVVACDLRGRVRPGARAVTGTAVLLPPSETENARRLMESRYLTARIGGWFARTFPIRRPDAVAIVVAL